MNTRKLRTLALSVAFGFLGLWSARNADAQTGPYLSHTATAANSSGNVTYLDDARINGNPNLILMATQNWSGTGVYNNHHIGVWYNSFLRRWAIFNEDRIAMPRNASFFVYSSIVAPSQAFCQIASSANTSAHITYIDSATTNGHPELKLFVTPVYNPNNIYNNHAIGVWYSTSRRQWAIFNQDRAAMPVGAAFNVFVLQAGGIAYQTPTDNVATSIFTHIANAANSSFDYTLFNARGVPKATSSVFVTAYYNPYGVYSNHELGVWWYPTTSVWSLFNEDLQPVPNNSAYNVWMRWTTPRLLTH